MALTRAYLESLDDAELKGERVSEDYELNRKRTLELCWLHWDSDRSIHVAAVAARYGVKSGWLRICKKRAVGIPQQSAGRPSYLSNEDMEDLEHLIRDMARINLPLSYQQIIAVAHEFHLERTGNDEWPCRSWFLTHFGKEINGISLGKGKTITIHRMLSAHLPSAISTMELLKSTIKDNAIPLRNIWYADETDSSFDLFKGKRVSVDRRCWWLAALLQVHSNGSFRSLTSRARFQR